MNTMRVPSGDSANEPDSAEPVDGGISNRTGGSVGNGWRGPPEDPHRGRCRDRDGDQDRQCQRSAWKRAKRAPALQSARIRVRDRRALAAALSDPSAGIGAADRSTPGGVCAGSAVPVGIAGERLRDRIGPRLASKWRATRQHLEQHASERPHVGALVDGLAARLLGTHVSRGADDHALSCAGDGRVVARRRCRTAFARCRNRAA